MALKDKFTRAGTIVSGLLDGRDLLLYVGLGLIAYGLWPIFPPAAFIVPGVVLTGLAIFGTR